MITDTIITEGTAEQIISFVDEVITPKMMKFAEDCGAPYKSMHIPKGKHFEDYLVRMYEEYSIINTLVFHNSQRLLKEIYVEQTLVNNYISDKRFRHTKIDQFPTELIKKFKKILITDTAGMGKSTIMKRMLISLIDNGMKDIGIPIYIELNRLKNDRTILMDIQEELNLLAKEFDEKLLLMLIQTGGFIFFFDGYDEILISDRKKVTKDIQDFISKAGTKNLYILTSRPEDSLTSFGHFQEFSIQPLKKKEAFELLKKYDLSKKRGLSGKLVRLLRSGEYNSINEYLENPLLVSLLYAAFDYKNIIPLKKHQFYRQVYEAYFDSHDLTKGIDAHQKRSGLDIDDFNRVLRYVGYECLIKIGVQFDKNTILKSIDKAKVFCGNLDFGSDDFLKDLLIAVPLFSKDGTEYKWAHKSLMEYFAALFVFWDAKQNQDTILEAISQSKHVDKYINMLDLYYDIDTNGFLKNITLPLCENYVKFYDEHSIQISVNNELVDERIAFLFWGKYAFVTKPDESMLKDSWELDNLGFSINEIERYGYGDDECLYLAKSFFYSDSLMTLLYRKRPFIFNKTRGIQDHSRLLRYIYAYYDNSFSKYNACLVNVKTGCDTEELYDAVNQLIICFKGFHLNYIECKMDAERITKMISNSSSILINEI